MPHTYTEEQLDTQYKKLPEALKDAMFSPTVAEKMFEIGKKNGLTIERIGFMAEEAGFVILGLTRPREFIKILTDRLEVDLDRAGKIASEINSGIFFPLREALKSTHQIEVGEAELQKEELVVKKAPAAPAEPPATFSKPETPQPATPTSTSKSPETPTPPAEKISIPIQTAPPTQSRPIPQPPPQEIPRQSPASTPPPPEAVRADAPLPIAEEPELETFDIKDGAMPAEADSEKKLPVPELPQEIESSKNEFLPPIVAPDTKPYPAPVPVPAVPTPSVPSSVPPEPTDTSRPLPLQESEQTPIQIQAPSPQSQESRPAPAPPSPETPQSPASPPPGPIAPAPEAKTQYGGYDPYREPTE